MFKYLNYEQTETEKKNHVYLVPLRTLSEITFMFHLGKESQFLILIFVTFRFSWNALNH